VSELVEAVEAVETIEHSRVDEPAEKLVYEERLRVAKHIVQAMQAVRIDCELVEAVVERVLHDRRLL
jgi:hypothetical protein